MRTIKVNFIIKGRELFRTPVNCSACDVGSNLNQNEVGVAECPQQPGAICIVE
jgi:hypothetical protein